MQILSVLKASQLEVGDRLVVREDIMGEFMGVEVTYVAHVQPKLQIGTLSVGPLYISPDAVVAVFTEAS